MKKRKGSTLMFVVTVFAVMFIISVSLTMLTSHNIRQSVILKQRMETYYLMLSGIEIGQYTVLDSTATDPGDMILPDYQKADYSGESQEIWFCDPDDPQVRLPTDNYATHPDHDDHEHCCHVLVRLSVTDADGGALPPSPTKDKIYLNIFAQAEWTPKNGATTRHAGTMRMWAANPARQFREIADFV